MVFHLPNWWGRKLKLPWCHYYDQTHKASKVPYRNKRKQCLCYKNCILRRSFKDSVKRTSRKLWVWSRLQEKKLVQKTHHSPSLNRLKGNSKGRVKDNKRNFQKDRKNQTLPNSQRLNKDLLRMVSLHSLWYINLCLQNNHHQTKTLEHSQLVRIP